MKGGVAACLGVCGSMCAVVMVCSVLHHCCRGSFSGRPWLGADECAALADGVLSVALAGAVRRTEHIVGMLLEAQVVDIGEVAVAAWRRRRWAATDGDRSDERGRLLIAMAS